MYTYSTPVDVGVKQGCVLAPIILIMSLVSIALAHHRDLQSSDSVENEHSVDGGLFNLQPFLALLLADFNVVLTSSLRYFSYPAL